MEFFFGLLLLSVLFGAFLGIVVPLGLKLSGYALMYLAIALGVSLRFTIKGLLWVAIWAGVRAGRFIHFAALLLYFLIEEKLRGAQDEEIDEEWGDGSEEPEDQAETAPSETAYETALKLFGLLPGLTKAELRRAYIDAIKRAHPDVGGNARQAQAINAARDLVMDWNGWA